MEPGQRRVRRLPASVIGGLAEAWPFPNPRGATPEGLIAYGGDLGPERLIAAYAQGIFPWYDEPPILWFSPNPRVVLRPGDLRINRTLAKNLRRGRFELRIDTAFRAVVEACAAAPRPGQAGTWINEDMIAAYTELHALGFAHSFESFFEGELVGGVYGVSLGAAFFGESMFAKRSEASKVALVHLVRFIEALGFDFLDCQAPTEHTRRLGAEPWPRDDFLEALARALSTPTLCGSWSRVEEIRTADVSDAPLPARITNGRDGHAGGTEGGHHE